MDFQLVTSYKPKGDQPRAIDELLAGLAAGERHQVLLGVTGSGKTFTMAKIIEASNRPALILEQVPKGDLRRPVDPEQAD